MLPVSRSLLQERRVISLLLVAEPAQLAALTKSCLHLPCEIC